MPRPPISTAFMDESKHKGFILVASICPTKELVHIRREMESLLLPGQTRLHFRKEKYARKRAILSVIEQLPVLHLVFNASSIKHENRARMASLTSFLKMRSEYRVDDLRIEMDSAHFSFDKRVLSHSKNDGLHFTHQAAKHDPGLWIPDAIAWCYSQEGQWRSLINYERVQVL